MFASTKLLLSGDTAHELAIQNINMTICPFSFSVMKMTLLESGMCMTVPFNRVTIKQAIESEDMTDHPTNLAGVHNPNHSFMSSVICYM
jgi:hypothetical protein